MKIKLNQSGAIFALALIALSTILVITIVLAFSSFTYKESSRYSLDSLEVTNLAEAGIDKAVASINATGGTYNGESETFLGAGSYSVAITSINPTTQQILSTGYIPNKTNPKVKKILSIQVSKGVGISFIYGMLVGNGGISMGNGAKINGSIYTNGNLSGGNNETITGDVYVAGGTQSTANPEGDCTSPNCSDFIFGKNVGGSNQLDIAQSFKPTSTAVINKVSLKLKKVGTPSNITVRLLGDNNGKPNKSNVLTTGVLLANLVTNEYGFVDVAFNSNPTLTVNIPYWILLDTSSNSSNYWSWSLDTLGTYTGGSPEWSPDWQSNNPVWNNISGDLGFKIWMGGIATSVSMDNGSVIKGNVHANTISGVTINKDAYYQIISESIVKGISYPNSTDPPPVAMPISEANISEWQTDAESRGTSGSISGCPSTMGPGKITGNVTINNSCNVTVKTPIWITGNLSTGNSDILRMDPSLGSTSGVIIVGGTTTFSNGDDLLGTGVAGSYLTLLSTYNSPQNNGIIAINTNNSSITGILYAPYGTISLANNANFKEAVAWKINMGNNTVLTYDSGLISTFFSAGPGGSYTVIKGTYQSN